MRRAKTRKAAAKGLPMSSPSGSMDAAGAAHGVYSFAVEPHVATAVWAIVLAIACALVIVIAEMVKARNPAPVSKKRDGPKNPPG
jgi:hypothetical protein